MKITLAYNLRSEETEEQAELLLQEDVDRLQDALEEIGHDVTPVEVSVPGPEVVDRILSSEPQLIFNVAEGTEGTSREALYPAIYKHLGIPYTGGGASLLFVELDKRLAEKLLEVRGIRVPKGCLLTAEDRELPERLAFPLFVKPNFEGSSKGITERSICETRKEVEEIVDELLETYPEGVNVEEFIRGRELSVPMLEAFPGGILEVVEHRVHGLEANIYDYDTKHGEGEGEVEVDCPAELSPENRRAVIGLAQKVFDQSPCPDLGRVDIRLREDGTPFFIERNPLPSLHPEASMMVAGRARDLEFADVLDLVVRSASRRYGLKTEPTAVLIEQREKDRPTTRELGIEVGRFPSGEWNAITDVKGVRVGHVTHIREDAPVDDDGSPAVVRTGVTAIVPGKRELLHKQLVAGGFILNGVGEVSGLTQAMEWGWMETPILLTNTMSVGVVHSGLISHLIQEYPELGREIEVLIPLIGETDDSFLNDVRAPALTAEDAIEALKNAKDGPVEQGSVGGGTGMVSFDFAGGIGSSSRVLPSRHGGYTVGVLVQSNFGKMRNLTIDGSVIGRELDSMFPMEGRRGRSYGSVLVIVATDAPMLSPQLEALSRRAALGLGRVGSWAATTSGEIVLSFSTGNRISRKEKSECLRLDLEFITDRHMNPLYEAVVEATEEAVLNSMFCSPGMDGREDRYAPPIPSEKIAEMMSKSTLEMKRTTETE